MSFKINRYLDDQDMDNIDHALGRPVDPLGETTRAYFATDCDTQMANFKASSHWTQGRSFGGMTWFYVTPQGRAALSTHLKSIGDPHRLYAVTYAPNCQESRTVTIAAVSRGAAKYARWLAISDTRELSFCEFCKHVSARLV